MSCCFLHDKQKLFINNIPFQCWIIFNLNVVHFLKTFKQRKITMNEFMFLHVCWNRQWSNNACQQVQIQKKKIIIIEKCVFQTHFSCHTELIENYSLLELRAMANVLENDPKWRFIRFNSYYWLCASGNRFIVPIRQREYILLFSVATVSIELTFSLKWYYTEFFIKRFIENDND